MFKTQYSELQISICHFERRENSVLIVSCYELRERPSPITCALNIELICTLTHCQICILNHCFVATTAIPSSLSCSFSTDEGASIITSRPALFLGKAIQSRMLSNPAKIETNRSNPKAIPPCGGAPYWKASIKNPNCSCARSSVKPNTENIFFL